MTRVLVVEDSPTQAERLRSDLAANGFDVRVARNAPDALKTLQGEVVDLVVSDVVMPGMDGYQLCRRIKDDPRTQQVPVVLLTSLTDPLDVVSGLESGADNFIRKPYQTDQLLTRLRTVVHTRDVRRDAQEGTGVRVSFLERDLHVTAERQQILDLLISTFEEVVMTTREIKLRESELAEAHAALKQQLGTVDLERSRLQALVDAVPVPLFVVADDRRVTHASESLAAVLGIKPDELLGRTIDDVTEFVDVNGVPIAPELLPHHTALDTGHTVSVGWTFDVCLRGLGGQRVPVMFQCSPVLDDRGKGAGGIGSIQIIGSLASHDSATGLPNRAAFLEWASAIPGAQAGDTAVILMELDRFEVVRASLGSEQSAQLLVDVTRRLSDLFHGGTGLQARAEGQLAYLGGDQFGAILSDLPDAMSVLRLAESARGVVSSCFTGRAEVPLTVSIGVAVGGAQLEVPELLAAARAALRRSSDGGGDRIEFFGPDASHEQLERLRLEVDLRAAVERGDIDVEYQPAMSLSTNGLLGFEALARWSHPRLGHVSPGLFIGLAEESGIILELGRDVLRKACTEACRWQAQAGGRDLTVSVNVSALQLRPELIQEVTDVLRETGLDPSLLLLELTETAAMRDPEVTAPVLNELRRRGVRLSLDDFGTGYSSMAHLTRMHFDQLKLDRSFVAGMLNGGADGVVVHSIVALGKALGVPVLAEGIEEEEQAEALRALGCEQGQGFLFSRSMPQEAAMNFIADHAEGASRMVQ
jgi:diguanylate cyclase (GGDEF)-like protein